MKGIILDEVRVLDQANKNCSFDEDSTLLSEDRAILIRAESVFAGSGFSALAAVGIRFEDSQCDSLSETTDGFVRLCGTPH